MSVVLGSRSSARRRSAAALATTLMVALTAARGPSTSSAKPAGRALSLHEIVLGSTHVLVVRPPRAPRPATTKIKENLAGDSAVGSTRQRRAPPFIYWQSHFVVERQLHPRPRPGQDLQGRAITVYPADLAARRAFHRRYYLERSQPPPKQDHYQGAPAADLEGSRIVFLTLQRGQPPTLAFSALDAFDTVARLAEVERLLALRGPVDATANRP